MKDRGKRSWLTGKFSTARAVWAPYNASTGTRISPIVSRSMRWASGIITRRLARAAHGFHIERHRDLRQLLVGLPLFIQRLLQQGCGFVMPQHFRPGASRPITGHLVVLYLLRSLND